MKKKTVLLLLLNFCNKLSCQHSTALVKGSLAIHRNCPVHPLEKNSNLNE